MYIVEIINRNTRNKIGPTLFTGDRGDYTHLSDATDAAYRWISENCDNPDEYSIVRRIVGCL